ncbi:hypothetical protein [Robertkochia sediminum]|uniref:hypothetical protein n=1 Tax=Robertkochia sediminum TaxID=2785326 RepID=UPI001F3E62B7|nr:hypothetical protein [Robertkochia sediminum]
MKWNFLMKIGSLLFTLLLIISCSDNDDPVTRGQLRISVGNSLDSEGAKGMVANREVAPGLDITTFLINMEEFELEIDHEDDDYDGEDDDEMWDDDGYYDSEDEFELEGPFVVDMLAGKVELMNINMPMGPFDEIEFDFEKSDDPESILFGKSILVEGTFEGVPFIFWHDFMDEIEVDFEDVEKDIVITEGTESVTIYFDIANMFSLEQGIDLSEAKDGNGDGVIEISPKDEDGNNQLAHDLKEALKAHIDLLDD